MTPRQKIAVIGAGIIGVMCARQLRERGHSVTLYDPDGVAKGCSYGNAGYIAVDEALPMARPDVLTRVPAMLRNPLAPLSIRKGDFRHLLPWFMRFAWATRPPQVERGANILGALFARTRDLWPEAMKDAGLEHLIQKKGMLKTYESMKSFKQGQAERRVQDKIGVNYKILDGEAAREIIPTLTKKVVRALWFEDNYHFLDPALVTRELAEGFFEEGGHLDERAIREVAVDGGRVKGVISDKGLHEADAVVVAAGFKSGHLLGPAGVNLPLMAERGYHVMVEDQGFEAGLTSMDRGFLMTPMTINGGAKSLRLAGTVEFSRHDMPETWDRAERLMDNARALLPGAEISAKSRWMGNRPTLPDFLPAIGEAKRTKGLFIATGHQHLGLTLSAVTGDIIAALVEGDTPFTDISALDPNRF